MKLTPIDTSQTNIRVGLEIMGKVYTNAREWNGKFAQLQNQHQYPKDTKTKTRFGEVLNNNLGKFKLNVGMCGLCQLEKEKSEMEFLCKCHHLYCFSCLNSYAISKIEDLSPVKCPQQDCSQTMLLTSNVYRYLPDSVKLKYLQNKHTFNINKDGEANRCQRCLEPKHSGECKYSLTPNLVENSFRFRECPDCKVEIRLTTGKRKVTCSKCQSSICYLCGERWVNGHDCVEKAKIRELERLNGYTGCCSCCCECCSHGCENNCVGCGDCCCRQCRSCCLEGFCCGILFYCGDEPGLGCCIWNILSIPIRMMLTLLTILVFSLLFFCVLAVICCWLFLCLVGGAFAIAMQTICQARCPFNIILILFMPLTILYAFGVAVAETYKVPVGMMGELAEHFCGILGSIWEQLSPKRCTY